MELLSTLILVVAVATVASIRSQPTEPTPLWEIGKTDGNTSEFAFAPGGWDKYEKDPVFVVGSSETKKDWPYVLPGPADPWGGNRPHHATIVFQLNEKPTEGEALLKLAFADTHSFAPPILRVRVNGNETQHNLPGGAGDDSINGKPEKGKRHDLRIRIPIDQLHEGTNLIEIANEAGCWLLWDSIQLQAPAGTKLGTVKPSHTAVVRKLAIRGLIEQDGKLVQPVEVVFHNAGAPKTFRLEGGNATATAKLENEQTTVRVLVPAVEKPTDIVLKAQAGEELFEIPVTLKPVRQMSLFILNHSHVDIGYTDTQEAVARKQVANLQKAIKLARESADQPEGSRFVWNAEVSWTIDMYRRQLGQKERDELDDAIRKGWVNLEGVYLNLLTGLCHPEELVQSTRFALAEGERLGVKVDTAMLSDTPGYTWGLINALSDAGIRYLSVGHNRGYTYLDNLAFWWESPSGEERVLVWTPFGGYDLCSLIQRIDDRWLSGYQDQLDKSNYAYDVAYIRWNGIGDNAEPEPNATEFARRWNQEYAWPKLVVASTRTAFQEFEKRHGKDIPVLRKEFTPLWEDGAASSALETAINRAAAERLEQAQTLFAISGATYPAEEFARAWEAVMLFSEHTWGSYLSIQDPEHPQTKSQWAHKRGLALDAERRSKELLARATKAQSGKGTFSVINTNGWERSSIVRIAAESSRSGDRVVDEVGKPVPSQRLTTGELAVWVEQLPAYGRRNYQIVAGNPHRAKQVNIKGLELSNDLLRLRINPATGAIESLYLAGQPANLVDTSTGHGLNEYLYLAGADTPDKAKKSNPTKVTILEKGPLVASFRIESTAPGVKALVRTVRLSAGEDFVEVENYLDKERAPATPGEKSYWPHTSKESVYISFPFAVPFGATLIDRPFAVFDPVTDMTPDNMHNWYTVGRWAKATGTHGSVTLATPDTPLIMVGGITNWIDAPWSKVQPKSAHMVVWAMNNYWATNYKAYQEGPVTFRFAIRPSASQEHSATSRFAQGYAQPLLVVGGKPEVKGLPFTVKGDDVTVVSLKPTDDGKGYLVRLFEPNGKGGIVEVAAAAGRPLSVWSSDTTEKRLEKLEGPLKLLPYGNVTLRIEP